MLPCSSLGKGTEYQEICVHSVDHRNLSLSNSLLQHQINHQHSCFIGQYQGNCTFIAAAKIFAFSVPTKFYISKNFELHGSIYSLKCLFPPIIYRITSTMTEHNKRIVNRGTQRMKEGSEFDIIYGRIYTCTTNMFTEFISIYFMLRNSRMRKLK